MNGAGSVRILASDLSSKSAKHVSRGKKLGEINLIFIVLWSRIKKLKLKPSITLIDGNKLPELNGYKVKYVIKGDQKISEISAASIIAKVARDKLITKLSKKFKKYAWDKNAGYGTKEHLKAIKKYGITQHHRKTFRPIHNMLSPS